jgi:NADH dehydrogenase
MAQIIRNKKLPMVSIPDSLGLLVGNIMGFFMGDVVITKAEIEGLKSNLLYVDTPPTGTTRLTDWLREHRDTVGIRYASELSRRKTEPPS